MPMLGAYGSSISQAQIALTQLQNAGGAAGDIMYWDGTNWVRLAKPSATSSVLLGGTTPSYVKVYTEIARTTTGSNLTTFTLSSIPARAYLFFTLEYEIVTSSVTSGLQFNADTGANYAERRGENIGGTSTTNLSATDIQLVSAAAGDRMFCMGWIRNLTAKVKHVQCFPSNNTQSAASVGGMIPTTAQWNNTAAQISSITVMRDSGTGSFVSGAELIVYGSD